MLFIGIDIAKNKHDMAIIDSNGNIILKHLAFTNNKQGFDKLHSKIMELAHSYVFDVYIAFEDTGHYGLNLRTFLRKYYLNIFSYNPLLIKKFAEGQTLRKTKTDKKDALMIARQLLNDFNNSKLVQPVVTETLMTELKFATRHRNRLTRHYSDAKVQYTRILDIIFPELASIVNKHNLSTYALLKKFLSAESIANARPSSLSKIKYLNTEIALKLKDKAKVSIGAQSKSLEFERLITIENIEHLNKQIERIDEQIQSLMIEIDSPITTVSGIGDRLGAVILAEIRDINNFESPAQLQSFAGLEPSINQSGQSDKTGKMLKRGSPHLRWAIILAARSVANYSPTFNAYLQKKLSEGKHYNTAISHIAKKLIRIIFYLLKNNRQFDEFSVG